MGFGVSHQKAGLNWEGKYKECSRERRLADAWKRTRGSGRAGAGPGDGETRGNSEHAKWRRITGITAAVEPFMTAKERKKGLRRLVKRIKQLTAEGAEDAEENPKSEIRNPKETENGERENPSPGANAPPSPSRGEGNCDAGGTPALQPAGRRRYNGDKLSLVTEWKSGVEEWAGAAENSVESLCVGLQISRARLTMLTKEYCGLTAQELVDGFKVRELRKHLTVRLREAAERLWGLPGSFAAWKYEGFREPPRRQGRQEGQGFRADKRSRYFRMRPEEYAAEERYEERERRIGELAREVRRDFDLESWAVSAGFASGARLKRACVNVLGKSLRTLERQLAAEVVRYYLCAEDKVLREIACQETESPNVIRARWIYNESEDAPTEPFLDEWSKAVALARDWLEKMRGEFG